MPKSFDERSSASDSSKTNGNGGGGFARRMRRLSLKNLRPDKGASGGEEAEPVPKKGILQRRRSKASMSSKSNSSASSKKEKRRSKRYEDEDEDDESEDDDDDDDDDEEDEEEEFEQLTVNENNNASGKHPTEPQTPKTSEPSTPSTPSKQPTSKDPKPKDPTSKDPKPKDPTTKDPKPKDPTSKDPKPKSPSPKSPKPKTPTSSTPAPKQPSSSTPQAPDSSSGSTPPKPFDLGAKVLVFSPSQQMDVIQDQIDDVYKAQVDNQFGADRWAIFFLPGRYKLDVKVGYYTTVHGLGESPQDTVIDGAVRSKADWMEGNNATINFWRGIENLTVIPSIAEDSKQLVWATSQGTWVRRVHVMGTMILSDHGGWSSGGFIADSLVDGDIDNGTQQQYFVRNTSMKKFDGGAYAQVFVGCRGAPAEDWPHKPYSTVKKTPAVREKPYLTVDDSGDLVVNVPSLREKSTGPSWSHDATPHGGKATLATTKQSPVFSKWHVASPSDKTATLNAALAKGQSILFTPGVYQLTSALQVIHAHTVLLGLGLATLKPMNGTEAINTADVDGVHIAGLLLDAGQHVSTTLLRVGDAKSSRDHMKAPTVLSDVFCRVGGAGLGRSMSMMQINLKDTIVDNAWLWRADHGSGVGWYLNPCKNGLIVEADDVICYGLFVEHCQEYQTLWQGERGQVFFYQSEFPYDAPNNEVWSHTGIKGYSSYKIAPSVKSHYATGLGIYCVFLTTGIVAGTAISQPLSSGWYDVKDCLVRHATIVRFGGNPDTAIDHVINNLGGEASEHQKMSMLESAY